MEGTSKIGRDLSPILGYQHSDLMDQKQPRGNRNSTTTKKSLLLFLISNLFL